MMRKSTPDFEIHVDPSCLTDGLHDENETPDTMSVDRVASNQTIIHHEPCGDADKEEMDPAADGLEIAAGTEEHKENDPAEPKGGEEHDKEHEARERQLDRIEAQIHAAAKAVVASLEQENYGGHEASVLNMHEESILSVPTDASYSQEGTELTYNGTEATYESDHEQHSERDGGESSSHHDGDVEDDIFSDSGRSKRSSLNSCHSSDENRMLLTSPVVGEEAASSHENEPLSRIPSATSYMQVSEDVKHQTPSKVLDRPPFRTPSSVRAMQMSSPTPSIFSSSPRSAKRHMPTVSRLGTPGTLNSPSKRTPTRLKPRKPLPLVLLHVTVLPLQWPYSHVMSSQDVPPSLHKVQDCWRLLLDKLGDTVLERGILLPHPQDSYEILEERLLEALELPVRPRAKILKCGHYMGSLDSDASSDEEAEYSRGAKRNKEERKWCDICGRDIRVEEVGDVEKGEKRFRVKVYASNGLMRAGAWAAAWREMERVDVEIEPYVEGHLSVELEHLATITRHAIPAQDEHAIEDGFEDEEVGPEHIHDHTKLEEADINEDELAQRHAEEELRYKIAAEQEEMRRSVMAEERMREIYGDHHPEVSQSKPMRHTSSRASVHNDSLSELLLAAFKVAMRDRKNVAIVVLSLFVLILSLKPKAAVDIRPPVIMESSTAPQITTTAIMETVTQTIQVTKSVESIIAPPSSVASLSTTTLSTAPEPASVTESAKVMESQAPVVEVRETKPESSENEKDDRPAVEESLQEAIPEAPEEVKTAPPPLAQPTPESAETMHQDSEKTN